MAERNQHRAFSSEVETSSREENASKQKIRAPVLIQSEPITFQARRARQGGTRQAQKNAAFPTGKRRFVMITTCKEELLCPWQAWQRPTLPGLEP
jgi:hypothetical protein